MPMPSLLSALALIAVTGSAAAQPQAVIRVPQDAPTIQAALDSTGGDPRIELTAGLYRELVVVEGISPTFAPQPGAEGQVSWSADLDEDGVADGLAIDIRGAQTVQLAATIEGIEFLGAGIEAAFTQLEVHDCTFTGGIGEVGRPITATLCDLLVVDSLFHATDIPGDGGAALLDQTSAVFIESEFVECKSGNDGGAIWARPSAEPFLRVEIDMCRFRGNHATVKGGAVYAASSPSNSNLIYALLIRDSLFEQNNAGFYAGAVSAAAQITRCTFVENSAGRIGGAVSLFNAIWESNDIVDSVFIGNRTHSTQTGLGGAICFEGAPVRNSVFVRNSSVHGGAVFGGPLTGNTNAVTACVFVGNTAERGGAVSNVLPPNHCIFIGNAAPSGAAIYQTARSPRALHSIFFDNAGPTVSYVNPDVDVSATELRTIACVFSPDQSVALNGEPPTIPLTACIGDPLLIGPGAINLDPMFTRLPNDGGDGWGDDPLTPDIDESANDDFGDLTPLPGSPMIDAAPMLDDMPALDMAGNPRVHDDPGIPTARPDIGPYEFQGESCLADVNGDGAPTPADMNAWIDAFNIRAPLADQNRDGALTPADYHGWIINFNAGCP